MEGAAHVAAAGLDAYRYATATDRADIIYWNVVAGRTAELRHDALVAALRDAWGE